LYVKLAEIRGKPITIIAECKSQGEPRYVREAAEQLREYQANYPGAYPMMMAPFITESTAELLNAKRVGPLATSNILLASQ